MPIEKGIVDIKLANSPLAIECNAKHSKDGDEIYHGTESLVKINARLLVKAFSNKTSFIPCNKSIRILIDAKGVVPNRSTDGEGCWNGVVV